MNRQALFIILLAAIVLAACSRDEPADVSTEPAADAPTNRIDVSPTVRSNLGITFTDVQRRRVDRTIRVPGAFELKPKARHEYRMMLPGRVELMVDQLETVQPSDVLYRFQSPRWPELQQEIIAAEQDIDSARAAINVAQAALDEAHQRRDQIRSRLAALAEADFRQADLEAQAEQIEASIPRLKAELQQAETTLANAKRSRKHALRRASSATGLDESDLAADMEHEGEIVPAYMTIEWIDVRATESGVVESLAVTDGAFVEPPSVVLSTVDPDAVRFRAMLLQSDLSRISSNADARIAPPMSTGMTLDEGVPASLTIGLEAHPEQRTVTVLATPTGTAPWIRPGMSAFLEIVTDTSGGPALAIPRAAIVKDGIVHVFFRRDPNDSNKVIRVEADMAVADGRWVEIRSGLSLNDEVVLDGAYELKLASEQSGVSQKGGHFHADGTFHEDH